MPDIKYIGGSVMSTQTFPAGEAPRIMLTDCSGDLEIEAWDERSIEVECDGRIDEIGQGEEGLVIQGAQGDLRLRAPADTEVVGEDLSADVRVAGIRAVSLEQVGGDCGIENIAGAVRLSNIGGNLEVEGAESLVLEGSAGADVSVRNVGAVELGQVGADLDVSDARTVSVANVGADCDVVAVGESLRY